MVVVVDVVKDLLLLARSTYYCCAVDKYYCCAMGYIRTQHNNMYMDVVTVTVVVKKFICLVLILSDLITYHFHCMKRY